jgi:hypothetical protein
MSATQLAAAAAMATAALAACATGGGFTPDAPAALDAVLRARFDERIEHYMELRSIAAATAPAFEETADPADIKAAQEGLAARLRTIRADAQHGDIFLPRSGSVFVRLWRRN